MIERLISKYNSLSPKLVATFWFVVCAFLQKGISVIFTPVFTRIMSTSEYGQFNVYSSWNDILSIIFSLKLAQGVYAQGIVKYDKEKDEFSSAIQGLTFVLIILWFLIYISFSDYWNSLINLTTAQMIALFIKIWADEIFQIWAKRERTEYRYKLLVAIILLDAIIRPILGVILVINSEDKVTVRVWEMALVDFTLYIGLFIYQIVKGKTMFSKKIWKYALVFNIPLIPHFLSQVVLNCSDRIMIDNLIDSTSAGIYGLAYSISLLLNLFINSFSHAMTPWTFTQIKKKQSHRISKIGELALIFLGIANIVFIGLVPEIVWLFAPPQYYEAIWIIPPISISLLYQFSYYLFADIELYSENTKVTSVATMIGALLNLLLNYICIKQFGYFAAAYTTLFCYFFISILHYFAMRKISNSILHEKPVYDWKRIFGIDFIFTVGAFGLMSIYNYTIIRIVVIFALLVLIFIKRNTLKTILKEIGVYKQTT
ncbi:MAG: oligosaccharide flippase family protein [Saccharofermentans sp.]|nr:oligosaccharide flippase family protein [Saccharofermentans sp.]